MLNRFWGILTLFFALTASAAFAGDYYHCVEDNADDRTIEINLKKNALALWDNGWDFGELATVLESLPPQYLFESSNREHDHWEVWFKPSFDGAKGTATLNLGSENINFSCVEEIQPHDVFKTPVAEENKFSCGNVGGTEEWTIYVDLNNKLAGFFDNDTTVVVEFKEVKLLKSRPPQRIYLFEGRDTSGGPGEKLRISFNKTSLKGSVTFINKQGRERTLKALDGCVPKKIKLERERRY